MRKKCILFSGFIIFFLLFWFYNSYAFASVGTLVDEMSKQKSSTGAGLTGSKLLNLITNIFSLVQYVGTGISIVVMIKLGITYILSSVEQKADIVFGSILIVATVNILKYISDIVFAAFGETTISS